MERRRVVAVRGFQQSRRLDPDGVVGPDTWRALYEAGYVLGDRLLDYRRPMARGEDVAELQRRLNDLGFDAGKVDGVFGPDTQRALRDFQHNRQIAEDGITGPQVLGELRLVSRTAEKTGREAIREREWLRSLPRTLAGSRVYFDAGCRTDDERDRAWAAANGAALALQGRGGVPLMSRSADIEHARASPSPQSQPAWCRDDRFLPAPGRGARGLLLRQLDEPQRSGSATRRRDGGAPRPHGRWTGGARFSRRPGRRRW